MNKPVKKGECCAMMLCNITLLLLPQLTILQLMHCDCHSSVAVIMLTRRWTNNHLDRHDPQIPTRTVHHQHSLQIRFATWQQLRITLNFTWCQRSKFFHCQQISKPTITSLVIMSWSTLLYCLQGFGITLTCRHDCLPGDDGLKPYPHHEKKDSSDARGKVIWYQNPICAIKQVASTVTTKACTKTLVSFQ